MSTVSRPGVRFNMPARPDVEGFLEDAREIVESGWLAGGPFVERLEAELKPWTGSDHVVAVTSGTNGLVAAMNVLGEPGAEAIIPGYTFFATWEAVLWARMTPVIADVDERGLLDPAAVRAAATTRTRLVVPVHIAGQPAAMDEICAVAEQIGARVVGDAAHALGARHEDRPVGNDGHAEVFSINATKPLGAGEGGFVTVRSAQVEEGLRRFAYHGTKPGHDDTYGRGLNLRVPALTAALALRSLPGLAAQLRRREEIHHRYASAWHGLPLRLSGPLPGQRSTHSQQLIWLDHPGDTPPLLEWLAAAGIERRAYNSIAIPDLSGFEGVVASADRARDLARRSVAVPMHARLSDEQVEQVAEAVSGFFAHR
jgi:perosamine synthetase